MNTDGTPRSRISSLLDRVRVPAYTGTNRCWPCTVVNGIIILIVAGAAAVVSPAAGVVALVTGFVLVYIRGYLIPGTPQLTRRYLPTTIKQWFGKQPTQRASASEREVTRTLLSAGVLQPSWTDDGVSIASHLKASITVEAGHGPGDPFDPAVLTEFFGVPSSGIIVEQRDPPKLVVRGTQLSWPSRVALMIDLAIASALGPLLDEWSEADTEHRITLCRAVRAHLDWCPACGGAVVGAPNISDERSDLRLQCTNCDSLVYAPG